MNSKVVTQICASIHLEGNNMSKFSILKSDSRNESDGLNCFPKTGVLRTEYIYINFLISNIMKMD